MLKVKENTHYSYLSQKCLSTYYFTKFKVLIINKLLVWNFIFNRHLGKGRYINIKLIKNILILAKVNYLECDFSKIYKS